MNTSFQTSADTTTDYTLNQIQQHVTQSSTSMKNLLKVEEVAQFLGTIYLFSTLQFAWWWFPALLLLPDLSMIGYAISPAVGAVTYNLAHHKGVAVLVGLVGLAMGNQVLMLAGIILLAHSSMDRMLGYGLKYSDSFTHTSLGTIGRSDQ